MVALEIQQFEWFDLPKGHANADVHEACNAHPGRPLALVAPARNSISTSEIDGGWNGDITSGRTTFSELSSCWLHKNLQWHLETHQIDGIHGAQEGCTCERFMKTISSKQQDFEFSATKWRKLIHQKHQATHTGVPGPPYPQEFPTCGISTTWFNSGIAARTPSANLQVLEAMGQGILGKTFVNVFATHRYLHFFCTYNNIYIYFSLGTHLKMCIHWIVDITIF